MNIILYSTDCPRCRILKKKLDMAGLEYTINTDVDQMLKMGFQEAPVLGVDNAFMNCTQANAWLRSQI
jgi:hypothetical protein